MLFLRKNIKNQTRLRRDAPGGLLLFNLFYELWASPRLYIGPPSLNALFEKICDNWFKFCKKNISKVIRFLFISLKKLKNLGLRTQYDLSILWWIPTQFFTRNSNLFEFLKSDVNWLRNLSRKSSIHTDTTTLKYEFLQNVRKRLKSQEINKKRITLTLTLTLTLLMLQRLLNSFHVNIMNVNLFNSNLCGKWNIIIRI